MGNNIIKRAFSLFMTLLLLAALALSALLTVYPKIRGGTSLAVLTGSMIPTYHPGDAIVVLPVDHDQVTVGDVVAFKPKPDDPTLFTHRVIAKTAGGSEGAIITTQGDANTAADSPVPERAVVGKVAYSIPKLGFITLGMGEQKTVLIYILAGALYVYAFSAIFLSGFFKKKKTKTPEKKT